MARAVSRRQALGMMAGAGLAARQAGAAQEADRRPNILFLFSDDHHYQALGAAGNAHIHTPNLDRLAERGTLFLGGTVATPQCCPSRGILLSGRYTHQSGLRSNGQRSFRPDLGPTTMGELRRAGYHTALIGKWHVQPRPTECGFAEVRTWFPGGASRYTDPPLARGPESKPEPVQGHITDLFADDAVRFLQERSSDAKRSVPFFLWLAFNAPHSPLVATDYTEEELAVYHGKTAEELAPPVHGQWETRFDWAIYYTAITRLDRNIGRILAALERSGQASNTVVFFVGDNGFLCGAHNRQGKVLPWEGSVRVPFLASGPGVKARLRSNAPVSSVDLPATWLEFAGARIPREFAGSSLRPLLQGKTREEAFCEWDDPAPTALATRQPVEPYRQVRTRTHKYVLWESGREELYDFARDPQERNNLAGRAPDAQRDLEARLRRWMETTGDRARDWRRPNTQPRA